MDLILSYLPHKKKERKENKIEIDKSTPFAPNREPPPSSSPTSALPYSKLNHKYKYIIDSQINFEFEWTFAFLCWIFCVTRAENKKLKEW